MPLGLRDLTPLLQVFDLPASIAFYRNVLDFELIAGDDSWWALLAHGETRLMLNTAYEDGERPAVPDAARVRHHADVSVYFWCPDPDAVCAHVRSKGWPAPDPVNTTYGMRQLDIKDPDGFEICFICPVETASR
jgi:catechol 2,3-dioxygenase-like lactoylglutathione lyase family enzyme